MFRRCTKIILSATSIYLYIYISRLIRYKMIELQLHCIFFFMCLGINVIIITWAKYLQFIYKYLIIPIFIYYIKESKVIYLFWIFFWQKKIQKICFRKTFVRFWTVYPISLWFLSYFLMLNIDNNCNSLTTETIINC